MFDREFTDFVPAFNLTKNLISIFNIIRSRNVRRYLTSNEFTLVMSEVEFY